MRKIVIVACLNLGALVDISFFSGKPDAQDDETLVSALRNTNLLGLPMLNIPCAVTMKRLPSP